MKKVLEPKYLLFLLLVGFLPQGVLAQLDRDYFNADQLLRQQEYEKAYEKFYKLHQKNPSSFIYLNKATKCLINLKQYEKAISITQKAAQKKYYRPQAMIRLGEIHHVSGDTEQALSLWNQVLKENSGHHQIKLRVARVMSDRQVFDRAIEVYQQIRENFSNSGNITSDLANTYLQAGKYEKAMQEYLQMVKNNPGRMNFVQQRLIRYQNDQIYDVAILEISDFLEELNPGHPSYQNLQQLEVWLLMERNLHKRALVTAKNFEAQSSQLTYILYNLGSKLAAAQKFKLAEEAYSYYIDNDIYSVKFRSMQELSSIYRQWARYLENYNLGLSAKRNELYRKAYETLETIREQNPNYQQMHEVLVELSELSLDILHQPDTASKYLAELRNFSDSTLTAQTTYIEGRLHLYNQEYTRARLSFTKSTNQEQNGSLSEKGRYYLALTDFYSGDYEFAEIQLNALERQNTSYYANDAVQLRLWIQSGLQVDSTGNQLEPFAKAVEYFSQGKDRLGGNELQNLFEDGSYNPLIDDAILELSSHKTNNNVAFVYQALNRYLDKKGSASPLYERLLWEKARIADQLVTNDEIDISISTSLDSASTGQSSSAAKRATAVEIPDNVDELVSIYEEIILNFPNGFYASFVRERIKELQNIQT